MSPGAQLRGAGRVRRIAGAHVQGLAVGPTQGAGVGRAPGGDPVHRAGALDHPHDPPVDRVGHPDATGGVEADAVGHVGPQVGPHPGVGQRAVAVHGVRRQALAERLGHHQGVAAVGDDHAVGEQELLDHHPGLTVGLDADEAGAGGLGTGVDVEAEVADVGPAVVVDDHVVAVEGGQLGEVGDVVHAVGVESHELALDHGDELQAPVGEPAQPGDDVVALQDDLGLAVGGHGVDPAVVHVREPQPAVVPPRAFGEDQAVEQRSEGSVGQGALPRGWGDEGPGSWSRGVQLDRRREARRSYRSTARRISSSMRSG